MCSVGSLICCVKEHCVRIKGGNGRTDTITVGLTVRSLEEICCHGVKCSILGDWLREGPML